MSLKRCLAVFLFSVFCSVSQASGVDSCLEAADPVVRLVSFFTEIFEEGASEIHVLRSFVELEQDSQWGQELLESSLAGSPIYLEHFKSEYSKFDEAQQRSFRSFIVSLLSASEVVAEEKSQVEVDTQSSFEFVHIKKGAVGIPYVFGEKLETREASMDVDLEIMSTHVTLEMFQEVVGVDLMMSNDELEFPVHQSNIWMAMLFANRLSEREGYEPVYNLPDLNWIVGGREKAMALVADSIENMVGVVKKGDAKKKPDGYRLPTKEEWEFVLGSIEQDLKWEPSISTISLLRASENERYYWSRFNSKGNLQVVGSLNPFTVQGKEIFDLYGLVRCYLHPTGQTGRPDVPMLHLGSYLSTETGFVSNEIERFSGANSLNRATGFRLVREVSP